MAQEVSDITKAAATAARDVRDITPNKRARYTIPVARPVKSGMRGPTDVEPIKVGKLFYTRMEIAAGTGISLSHISKIFTGSREPSLRNAIQIAAFLRISVEELMGRIIPGVRRIG